MYIYLVPSPLPDALAAYPHLRLRGAEDQVLLAIETTDRSAVISSRMSRWSLTRLLTKPDHGLAADLLC